MQQWVYSNLHDIDGIWAWEKLKALKTWPQSWRKQFAVFQNALLSKLCGIPVLFKVWKGELRLGNLSSHTCQKHCFEFSIKNHQIRFLFLINNITGTKESYWMRVLSWCCLWVWWFFLRKMWNKYKLELVFFVNQMCPFNLWL